MSISWGLGEDWGGILTGGMGYVVVVIPITPPSPGVGEITYIPRVLHLPRTFVMSLEALGYVSKFEKWIPISLLNIKKINRITVLLSSLNVLISDELQILLKALSEISDKNVEVVDISGLSLTKDELNKYVSDKLLLLKLESDIFYLNGTKLIANLKQEIFANVPDIDEINMQQVAEILELLDTLEDVE